MLLLTILLAIFVVIFALMSIHFEEKATRKTIENNYLIDLLDGVTEREYAVTERENAVALRENNLPN